MNTLRAHLLFLACFMAALLYSAPLKASATNSDESDSLEEPVKCTKEELINFFPQQVVEHVLIKAKIPRDKAHKIAVELSQKNMELLNTVEEKSSHLQKNLSNNSNLQDQTIKIYGDTLHDMFTKVLKAYGIDDETQAQNLLEQIRLERSKHFIECLRLQQNSVQLPKESSPPVENTKS